MTSLLPWSPVLFALYAYALWLAGTMPPVVRREVWR